MIIGFTKQLQGFKLSPMLTGLSVPLTEEPSEFCVVSSAKSYVLVC